MKTPVFYKFRKFLTIQKIEMKDINNIKYHRLIVKLMKNILKKTIPNSYRYETFTMETFLVETLTTKQNL